MHKSTIISNTLLLLLTNSLAEKISPMCDMNSCSGYYKLMPHDIKKPKIEVTKTQVQMIEMTPEIDLVYVKRRWLSIYCYDGSSIDPNTGCYESITIENPSCSVVRDWTSKNICPTGWECRPDGDCIGSSATSKCFDRTTITTNRGPTLLKWEGSRYLSFPSHTCVSSWECNTFIMRADVFAQSSYNGEVVWVVYSKDNREFQLNTTFYNRGFENVNGEKLCMSSENLSPIKSIKDAHCYAENINNIKCMISSNDDKDGIVFDIDKSGIGIIRNMKITVVGPLMVPVDGKIIDINKNNAHKYDSITKIMTDRQRTVNVETAHELAISATVLQMQSLYNILSLSQELEEMYNALLHVVRSQSIDDPQLISKIIGKNRFATKWSNEEIFESCKCLNTEYDHYSNCFDNKIFSYGSYTTADDISRCYHIPKDSIQSLSLVNASTLHVDFIKYLPPQTASIDSSGWDALNDYRNNLVEGDKTSHSYENLNDKIIDIENKIGIGAVGNLFYYASCSAAWLALLLQILYRR